MENPTGKNPQDPKKPKRDDSTVRKMGFGVMIPAMLAACIVVGVWLGAAADDFFGSEPWGMLLGLALGIATGVREVIRLLRRMGS